VLRQVPVTLPEGYVDFYRNLETWQNEQQIRLQRDYLPVEADVKQLLNNNRPLIELVKFEINSNLYKDLHTKLLAFIKGSRNESGKVMDAIFNRVSELDFSDLAQKIAIQDYDHLTNLALDLGLPVELFLFTLDHAFRPFLRVFALPFSQALSSEEIANWPFPTQCPCCGSKSYISRLRSSDGRRFMFCDRCFSEWETSLIYCVHCGNSEPGSIKYVSIENDSAFQIYVCEKCKGYLKTINERKLGQSTDLFIANIETIYLDLLAREKGYSNHDE
jgi:FdhE protein